MTEKPNTFTAIHEMAITSFGLDGETVEPPSDWDNKEKASIEVEAGPYDGALIVSFPLPVTEVCLSPDEGFALALSLFSAVGAAKASGPFWPEGEAQEAEAAP